MSKLAELITVIFVSGTIATAVTLYASQPVTCPPIAEPEGPDPHELTWVMPLDAKQMTVVLYKPNGAYESQYTISDWVSLPPGTTLKLIAK